MDFFLDLGFKEKMYGIDSELDIGSFDEAKLNYILPVGVEILNLNDVIARDGEQAFYEKLTTVVKLVLEDIPGVTKDYIDSIDAEVLHKFFTGIFTIPEIDMINRYIMIWIFHIYQYWH